VVCFVGVGAFQGGLRTGSAWLGAFQGVCGLNLHGWVQNLVVSALPLPRTPIYRTTLTFYQTLSALYRTLLSGYRTF
jgi:hypothetical protein